MKFSISICMCLCVLFVASAVMADTGPPDPISIDRQSPSVVDFTETPGNIYDMPIPFGQGWDTGAAAVGMVVHEPDINYGLMPLQDNNDGHSNGEIDPWESPLLIYFSGDDKSMGMPMTDYEHQAMRMQAAGDRFVTNGPSMVPPAVALASGAQSGIAGPVMPGGMWNYPINLLSANQDRYNEIPSIGPLLFNGYMSPAGGTPMDDMDALELTPFRTSGQVLVHDTPIYFTLDAISPSLGVAGSGADVLVSSPGATSFVTFASASMLGLAPSDEVDALAVWDSDGMASFGDFALFSLAPLSPSLFVSLVGDANYDGVVSAGDYSAVQANFGNTGIPGSVLPGDADRGGMVSANDYSIVQANFGKSGGLSAADIFVTGFSGTNMLYLPAQALGMLHSDNIDALDVEIWIDDLAWFEEELLDQTGEEGGPAPEPATVTLLVIGGLALLKRRRK